MEKKYWFRPKSYGYGLEPISWQGWIAVLVFIGITGGAAYANGLFSPETVTVQATAHFIFDFFILIMILLIWAKDKTEGEMKWQWGGKK